MNTFSENTFLTRAIATLNQLDIAIECAAQAADIDIETNRHDHLLEIEFSDGNKIIINLQAPMQEIWVASKAGGFHFRYNNTDHCWLDTRDKQELYQLVTQLIHQHTNTMLNLKSNSHEQ